MKDISLKSKLENFINEEVDLALSKKSPFLSSIIKQLKRYSGNKEAIILIGKKYENIISMVKNNSFSGQQLDSFDKHHIKLALREINTLDSLPTAAQLVSKQLELDSAIPPPPVQDTRTPEEKAKDEMIAQYGSEENYKSGRGLGT